DVPPDDETGSQVVLLEDETGAAADVDLADVSAEDEVVVEEASASAALKGVRGRRRHDEDEEEEEAAAAAGATVAAPAPWGRWTCVRIWRAEPRERPGVARPGRSRGSARLTRRPSPAGSASWPTAAACPRPAAASPPCSA